MNTFDATPTDFSHASPNASAAACSEAGWRLVARILCFLVVSRLVFEAVNTFVWDSATTPGRPVPWSPSCSFFGRW